MLIVGLLWAGAVWADDDEDFARVPQTGQTIPYDTNVPPRDDGALQKGVESPTPRFTIRRGTVKDNLTGLIWLRDASCLGPTNWQGALNNVKALNDGTIVNNCGDTSKDGKHQTDWRLPNRNELTSLLDLGTFIPALPSGHPFTNFQPDFYWSSTTFANGTFDAWFVNFFGGGGKGNGGNFVLAVRGGS